MSENSGINVYGSKYQPIIPVMSRLSSPEKIDQKRNNINTGATLYYKPNTLNKIKFGFDYGDSINVYLIEKKFRGTH